MEMVTATADMGLTTSQVDIIIVWAVMGAIGHMMGVTVVTAPIKVGTALGATEDMVVMGVLADGILVIRADGCDCTAI